MYAREKPAKTGVRTRESERTGKVCVHMFLSKGVGLGACLLGRLKPSPDKAFRRGEQATKKRFPVVSRETGKN